MRFEKSHIEQIWRASLTWQEWVKAPKGASVVASETAERFLEEWAKGLGGTPEAIERRLSWAEMDLESVKRELSRVPLFSEEQVTEDSWLEVFDFDCSPVTSRLEDLPFCPLLSGFALAGVHLLKKRLSPTLQNTLSSEVFDQFEDFLTRRACRVAEETLFSEFDASRTRAGTAGERFSWSEYRDAWVASEGIAFFLKYPVLARRMATEIDDAVRNLTRALERFVADREELTCLVDCDLSDGAPVKRIGLGLSDRHNGGQQVLRFEFDEGKVAYYKPKPIEIDHAFHTFHAKLSGAEQTNSNLFLCREGYGWICEIKQCDFRESKDLERYYRECGALLLSAYLAQCRDLIMDNLIAAEGPFPIDCEAAFQPLPLPAAEQNHTVERFADTIPKYDFTVLETGLLPSWGNSAGPKTDISGLGGSAAYYSGTRTEFVESNTTRMSIKPVPNRVDCEKNLPRLNGQTVSAFHFVDEICDGFSKAYQNAEEELSQSPGMLDRSFSGFDIRFLFRPTQFYGVLLKKFSASAYLKSGLGRSVALEVLLKPFVSNCRKKPAAFDLVSRELASLARWDVPYFLTSTSDPRKSPLPEIAKGIDLARIRAQSLSDEDRDRQLRLIRNLFAQKPVFDYQIHVPKTPLQDRLVGEARTIGENLLSCGVSDFTDPGSHRSGGPTKDLEASDRSIARMGSLYSGIPGTSIFLAALYRVTGHLPFLEKSEELAQVSAQWVKSDAGAAALAGGPLGICFGRAGIVYGDLLRSRLTGGARLFGEELLLPGHLEWERTEADVTGGVAGYLILLSLLLESQDLEAVNSEDLQKQGIELSKDLLKAFDEGKDGGWEDVGKFKYTGYAHGAMGIFAALFRFAAVSGDESLRDKLKPRLGDWVSAKQAFDHLGRVDRSHWVPQNVNAWCHGAPGTLIAARSLLRVLKGWNDEVPGLKERAVEFLQAIPDLPPKESDDLCCGNLSRIEAIQGITGMDVDAPQLEAIATAILKRKETEGFYRIAPSRAVNVYEHPCLFKGVSGIGYQFLRAVYPDEIPSVLDLRL